MPSSLPPACYDGDIIFLFSQLGNKDIFNGLLASRVSANLIGQHAAAQILRREELIQPVAIEGIEAAPYRQSKERSQVDLADSFAVSPGPRVSPLIPNARSIGACS